MTCPFEAERKAARAAAKAAEALSDSLKILQTAAADLDERAFEVLPALADATSAARKLSDALASLPELQASLSALSKEAEAAAERSRARMVGGLADALDAQGFTLTGRLPNLQCGPLTLELKGGKKPEVVVHYGPRIAALASAPMDPEAVAKAVKAAMAEVAPEPLDDHGFLERLFVAWRVAQARLGLGPGDKAPIVAVLAELAAGMQSAAWRQDPSRGRFKSYSRVRFSHDLGRLKTRRADGRELMLTVATRDQTKKASDHLWVDGTHYAYLSFREA
jgi:hypothetical protein